MRPYRQTTNFTCAPASLAIAINHFKPTFLLNVDNEFDIWQKTATLPTRGSSIYALAIYAKEQGIDPKVVVGSLDYKFPGYKFKSYKKQDVMVANFCSERFYQHAKKKGIPIEERDFTLNEVKELISKGKILMLRLVIGIMRSSKFNRRSPHYVCVYGFKDGRFDVMDPKKGELRVDEETMQEAFDKVLELKRDHRMIVFG